MHWNVPEWNTALVAVRNYKAIWASRGSNVACRLQSEFHGVRSEMEKEAMRAAKLEQRLAVLTKGYVMREAALRKSIETSWQTLQASQQVRVLAVPLF